MYIVYMKTIKFAIFLALFSMLTIGAFGDSFYSVAGSFHSLYEQYPDENYGIDRQGGDFIIMLNYYPEKSPIGWYLRTSFGSSIVGWEWKDTEVSPVDTYGSSEIQISAGPSIRFKLGQYFHLPISFGPAFSIIREESDYYLYNYSSNFSNALNLGLHLDISLILNPISALTIVNGLYASFDFLHWERGYTEGTYRSINSGTYKFENYAGFKFGFYLGIGLHFD